MKIEFWVTGSTAHKYLETGIETYVQRISHYVSFGYEEIRISSRKRSRDPAQVQEIERDEILKRLAADDHLILLDEKGKTFSSRQLAKHLQKLLNHTPGRIIFLAGGAHGFHADVYARAPEKLSLSALTFPHDLVRLVFAEQLYRVFTILHNESYHH